MRSLFLCFGALFMSALLATSCSDTEGQTTSTSTSSSSSSSGDEGNPCTDDADCKVGFMLLCAPTDDGMCGPITKKCVQFPPSCGEGTFTTVCGCDGKSHADGPCPSANPPFQIDTRPGGCPPAAGTISCGDGACMISAQYCLGDTMSVKCTDLPATCMGAQANCACLEMAGMAACGCVDEPGGGIRVNGCSI